MPSIPIELYHPLVVHFPIGLLIGATLCFLVSLIRHFQWLRNPAIVMGVLGVAVGYLAKQTGEMAAGEIGPHFCNLELLSKHASQAETALIFFAAAWGLAALGHLLRGKFFFPAANPFWWKLLLVFGMLMGSAYLTLAGHKGFQMVFEHGAAVKSPIRYCN